MMIWFLLFLGLLLLFALTIGSLVILDAVRWEPQRIRREENARILREFAPRFTEAMQKMNTQMLTLQKTTDDCSRAFAKFYSTIGKSLPVDQRTN